MVISTLSVLACQVEPARESAFEFADITYYSINRMREKSNFRYSVRYEGSKAIVSRNEMYQVDTSALYNVVYYNTDNFTLDTFGVLTIKDSARPLWFIPNSLGIDPMPLVNDGRSCFKYYCNCTGIASAALVSSCTVQKEQAGVIRCLSTDHPECSGKSTGLCMGSVAMVPCLMEEDENEDHLFYEGFSGGLILEATSVELTDPVWFKKKLNNTLEFVQDDDGDLYLKEDYLETISTLKK